MGLLDPPALTKAVADATYAQAAAAPPPSSTNPPPSLPRVIIDTTNRAPVVDKVNYLDATITINGVQAFSGTTQIRGRGNYTWTLPKKPYRLKLTANASLLGMPAERDWVLLANHTDSTKIRNAVAFEIGNRCPGLSWTPRMRFVELVLNGDYLGVYQLGEHVEISAQKINVTKATGTTGLALTGAYSLEIDQRLESDNEVGFRTTLKNIPIVTDDPDGTDATQKAYIQQWINNFESVLFGASWLDPSAGYARLIDMPSFIDWYIVEELCSNQDSDFFSSCKLVKTRDTATVPGKLYMGPLWDFDISLGNVVNTPHPAVGYYTRDDESGGLGPGAVWIKRMLDDPTFFTALVGRWATLRQNLLTGDSVGAVVDRLTDRLAQALGRDQRAWSYTANTATDGEAMKTWLRQRIAWLNTEWVIDTTPPSTPTNLTATSGSSAVSLSWNASSDNVLVAGYRVRQGGSLVASPTGTSATITGLTNGTAYSFTVSAVDKAGNESAQSAAVSATPANVTFTDPNSLAGLHVWWKADSLSLADGAAVASWPDSGTGSHTALQVTSAAQPIFKTGIVNSKPVVRFPDSVDRWMTSDASASLPAQTVFAVLRPSATPQSTGGPNRAIIGSSGTGGLEYRHNADKRPEIIKQYVSNIGNANSYLSTTAFSVIAVTYADAASYAFYLNGAVDGGGTHTVTLATGQTVHIGQSGSVNAERIAADMAEIIVYNRILNATERGQVTSYLGQKYGITVS